MKKRIAGYGRVSTDEQKKYGYSISAQIEKIERYTEEKGYELVDMYVDEGYTATNMKRPALMKLLENLHLYDMVVFTRLDRFSRNVLDANNMVKVMDKIGVAIKSIEEDDISTETADGKFNFNLRVSLAEREAQKTSERIKSIFEYKIANKQPIAGTQPYGYKVIDLPNGKKTVGKDPDLIPIVEDIFKYFLVFHSVRRVMFYVNEKYNLNRGYNTYNKIITDKEYYGEYKGNPDYYDPYITKEQWKRNQEIMKSNIRVGENKFVYLFTALLYCPTCGSKMVGKHTFADKRYNREYWHYQCPKAHRDNKCPNGKMINENAILEYLLENVEDLARDYIAEVIEVQALETEYSPELRIKELREKIKRITDAYIDGRKTKHEYEKECSAVEKEIGRLELRQPNKTNITILEEFLNSDWREIYDSLDKEHQRSLWRNLIKRIDFDEEFNPIITFL